MSAVVSADNKRIMEIDREIEKLDVKLKGVVGTDCEVYTRIVGYHRTTDNWNAGKKSEYKDRKVFDHASSMLAKAKRDEKAKKAQEV